MAEGQSSPLEELRQRLEAARSYDAAIREYNAQGQTVHVPDTGKAISSAYEQLRNAAEYAEEHLVLQRAIKRFYKRTLFILKRKPEDIGQELILELVQAGYLGDGNIGMKTAESISQLATDYAQIYRTESMLNPHTYHLAVAGFTYQHFLQHLPKNQFVKSPEESDDYYVALYIAVHQALLKSDLDVVRADLLNMFIQNADDIHTYITWNERIQELYGAQLTRRLRRIVIKNEAPFRILKSLAEDLPTLPDLLPHRDQFMSTFGMQIDSEYRRTEKRLNRGLVKSIVFLVITKTIIGISIEVPFDLYVYGTVILMPLIINLLFPPIYMASIRFGLIMPAGSDARATREFMDQMLYGDGAPRLSLLTRTKQYSAMAQLTYALLFLVPFGITVLLLQRLRFNPLQMIIFFVFFSTASFLGYRLSGMVRELKMGRKETRVLAIFWDFFYLPFIILGQWLAGKYARVNIIGTFLDTIIELPLKTVLRLIRQWIRFLNEKHDELY
jgi:hypothetical protein